MVHGSFEASLITSQDVGGQYVANRNFLYPLRRSSYVYGFEAVSIKFFGEDIHDIMHWFFFAHSIVQTE